MSHEAGRWNHNIHYHATLLSGLPVGARDALDVGCGEGMLTRRLAEQTGHVVGIDRDAASIAAARAAARSSSIDYVLGDFATHRFAPESFDVIVSVATLHHLDADVALARMRQLLRPGGVLAVLGLARTKRADDLLWDLGGAVTHRVNLRRHTLWEHPSPQVAPSIGYREMRRLADDRLPGCRYRRHLMWRYSIHWTKPTTSPERRA